MGIAQPSDAELLARLRSGDSAAHAAFALLRERYTRPVGQPPVRLVDGGAASVDAAAREPVSAESPADMAHGEVPEGLRGEPPDEGDQAERAVVLDAFATLPARSRAVLWLTEVEGCTIGVAGTRLGMTPVAAAALASRAGEQLRDAYLRARLHASPQPRCGRPHGSRLAGHVRLGERGGARTAVAAHVDGCSSCRALVTAVGDAPRLFARALVPWSAAPAGTTDSSALAGAPAGARARPSGSSSMLTSTNRPVRVIAGAGRQGRRAAALARGDPALTGTVAVAAALVVAVLAAAFLPGRVPVDVAAPRPGPADERVIVPALPPPAAAGPGLAPSTTVPGPAPSGRSDPAVTAPPRPARPDPDATGADQRVASATVPSATAPSPATGPTTTVPSPTLPVVPNGGTPTAPRGDDAAIGVASAPAVPAVRSAVWQPTGSRVEVTLVNAGASSTGFLVMTLQAAGGALVDAQPTGCALALGLVTSGMCTLRPLGPGASTVVRVPMTVTRRGQSAEVQVCAVAFLRLDCATPLLAPTVVALA